MKKSFLTVTMLITIAVLLGACGGDGAKRTVSSSSKQTVNSLIEQAASVQEEAKEEVKEDTKEDAPAEETSVVSVTSVEEETEPLSESIPDDGDVDIDLTKLSKTMVYSEVYNIMVNPGAYVGKTIRMGGEYYIYTDDTTSNKYFYCIIQDATACCAQGIEFILTDDYKFPDDYPEEGTNVTVVGRFDTYMEGEYLYCSLRDAVLEN